MPELATGPESDNQAGFSMRDLKLQTAEVAQAAPPPPEDSPPPRVEADNPAGENPEAAEPQPDVAADGQEGGETEDQPRLPELLEQVKKRGEEERQLLTAQSDAVTETFAHPYPGEIPGELTAINSQFDVCIEGSRLFEDNFGSALETLIPLEPLLADETIDELESIFNEYKSSVDEAIKTIAAEAAALSGPRP